MDPSLVIPTGNVVAMFFVLVAAFVVRATLSTRALAIVFAVAAALLPSIVPDARLPPGLVAWLATSPRAAFLVGFLPPIAAAGLVLWVRRRAE